MDSILCFMAGTVPGICVYHKCTYAENTHTVTSAVPCSCVSVCTSYFSYILYMNDQAKTIVQVSTLTEEGQCVLPEFGLSVVHFGSETSVCTVNQSSSLC